MITSSIVVVVVVVVADAETTVSLGSVILCYTYSSIPKPSAACIMCSHAVVVLRALSAMHWIDSMIQRSLWSE